MTQSCEEIKNAIALAPSGFLDDQERAALDDHLKTCEACSMKTDRYQSALEALNDDEADEVPSGMFERVLEKARAAAPMAPLFNEKEEPSRTIVLALSCAYCHGPLSRDEACYCASCLTPHHNDCFREHGRCTALGCEEVAVVRPQGLEGVSRRPRRSRLKVWGAALGATLLIGAGAAALVNEELTPRRAGTSIGVQSVTVAATDGSAPAPEPVKALIDLEAVDKDLREVMEDIGRQAGRNFLVAPGVSETVTISLKQIPVMDAAQIIARLCRCRIESAADGVFLLTQPPKVTIQFTDANLRTIVQLLASYSGKNIVISSGVRGNASLDLKDIDWDLALEAIAEAFNIHIRERGEVIVLTDKPSDWGKAVTQKVGVGNASLDAKVTLEAEGSLENLAEALSEATGLPFTVEGEATGRHRIQSNASLRETARNLAAAFGYEAIFAVDGVRLRPVTPNRFRARRVDARLWLQALGRFGGVNVIMPRFKGRLDVDSAGLPVHKVLANSAETLNLAFQEKDVVAAFVPGVGQVGNQAAAGKGEVFSIKTSQRASEFTLRLDAIIGRFEATKSSGLAIINDQILEVGDRLIGLDGEPIGSFLITEIARDSVAFSDASGVFFRAAFTP